MGGARVVWRYGGAYGWSKEKGECVWTRLANHSGQMEDEGRERSAAEACRFHWPVFVSRSLVSFVFSFSSFFMSPER